MLFCCSLIRKVILGDQGAADETCRAQLYGDVVMTLEFVPLKVPFHGTVSLKGKW